MEKHISVLRLPFESSATSEYPHRWLSDLIVLAIAKKLSKCFRHFSGTSSHILFQSLFWRETYQKALYYIIYTTLLFFSVFRFEAVGQNLKWFKYSLNLGYNNQTYLRLSECRAVFHYFNRPLVPITEPWTPIIQKYDQAYC